MSKRGCLEERQRAKSGRKFDSTLEASFGKSRKRENRRRGEAAAAPALAAANIGRGGNTDGGATRASERERARKDEMSSI